jgi:hypothetical protein
MAITRAADACKRRASSTHSSQQEERPHKAPKPDESSSQIEMIPASRLKFWRQRQARQNRDLTDQGLDNAIIAPGRNVGYKTRQERERLAEERARQARQADEDESEEDDEEYHVNYGGRNDDERDRRILGWAGSVADAEPEDENDALKREGSSDDVEEEEVADEEAEDDDTKGDQAEEADNVVDSNSENDQSNFRAMNTHTLGQQQLLHQTLRLSPRHRPGAQAFVAMMFETHIDLLAHLRKPTEDVYQSILKVYDQSPSKQKISAKCSGRNESKDQRTTFKYHASFVKDSEEYLEHVRKAAVDLLRRSGVECSAIPSDAANGGSISRGRGLNRDNHPSENIKYFDRDAPENLRREFEYNASTSSWGPIRYDDHDNSSKPSSPETRNVLAFHGRGRVVSYMSLATGVPTDDESSNSSSSETYDDAIGMFQPAPLGFSSHDAAFVGPINGYSSFVPKSASKTKLNHERKHFPNQGHEKHNLDRGSEPRGDGDFLTELASLLDSDGNVKAMQEPASDGGDSAADGDDEHDDEDAGSAGGNSRAASENDPLSEGDDGEGDEQQDDDEQSEQGDNASNSSSSSSSAPSENESGHENENDGDNQNNLTAPRPADYYHTHQILTPSGGFPDYPFAGPQTRQNTAPNRMRDQPLALGQGYASIPIAEQHGAQMLYALERTGRERLFGDTESEGGESEGRESDSGESDDGESDDGESDDGESGDGESVKDESVKEESVEAEDGQEQGVKDESDGGENDQGDNVKVESEG